MTSKYTVQHKSNDKNATMSYIVFFNSLGSQVKACYANTGHVLWMCLYRTQNAANYSCVAKNIKY